MSIEMTKKAATNVAILVATILTLARAAPAATVEQARKFIAKNKVCDLAIGYVSKSTDSLLYVEGALCIGDMVVKKGTIHEVSGCSLSIYDMKTNEHSNPRPWSWKDAPPTMASKPCASGGFKELLAKKVLMSCGPQTVSSALVCETAITLPYQRITPIVIYSTDDRYSQAFTKSKMEEEARQKKVATDAQQSKANAKKEDNKKQMKALEDSKKYRAEFFAFRLDISSDEAFEKTLQTKRNLYEDYIVTLDNDPSRACWHFDEAKGLEDIDAQIKNAPHIQVDGEIASFENFRNLVRDASIEEYRESISKKEPCQGEAQRALDELLSQDILPINDYTLSSDKSAFRSWLPSANDREPGRLCFWDRNKRDCEFVQYISHEDLAKMELIESAKKKLEAERRKDLHWNDITVKKRTGKKNCIREVATGCVFEDKITKLQWSTTLGDGAGVSEKQAAQICKKLSLNNAAGWRLPTSDELRTADAHGYSSLYGDRFSVTVWFDYSLDTELKDSKNSFTYTLIDLFTYTLLDGASNLEPIKIFGGGGTDTICVRSN